MSISPRLDSPPIPADAGFPAGILRHGVDVPGGLTGDPAPFPDLVKRLGALLNDVETAADLDVIAPGDDVLLGRVPDGGEAALMEEYSVARTAAGLP